MRFMMIIKADEKTEAGILPTEKDFAAMGKYNSELIKAGVMLDGAGLKPSSSGVKVEFAKGKPTVIDGPFSESKELVAGFWLIQVKSKEEAIEWAKRVPFNADMSGGGEGVIELRPLYEKEDFGPAVEAYDSLTREALKETRGAR